MQAEQIDIEARLDVPPSEDARLHLPDSFGTRFAMFGDAEEEFDWNGPFRRESTSTATIRALPEANARFRAAGLDPCWMVDWPVVDNPDSGTIMRELVASGECTVGTQLHPWVSPPFEEEVTRRNSYTCNLPYDLQREKLRRLTDRIEEVTGARPTAYRAGRYGVGRHTASLLREFGYALDVSVRSCFDYRSQGGPNFSRHPLWPWKVGDGLYELPLSTAYTGHFNRWPGLYLAESIRGTLARTGLLARIPLTPEGVPLADALEAIEALLGEGHRLFSLSFHTPSLVPGHTPYVRDAADLATFWRWWDGVFDRFAARGVTAVGSDEIVAAFRAADGVSA
ncbi:WalW protein [Sphingomonas sp. SUN039]|uniref:WalW protein n=1 Tax=Sphingomonas sp. SUN039 TaxID=2937787 RepID=UPI0021643BAB|nr:WalW protein [Sphingomonas sp. SUN039]UVO54012.1 WalW protein [Sphingomonas sp. SUN039]